MRQKLTKDQYLRADKKVCILIGAVLLYMIASMLFAIIQHTAQAGTYIQLGIFVAALIGCIVGYFTLRGKRICGSVMTGMGALSFLVMMSMGSEELTYVYAFPILITSIIYLNKRFAIVGSTVILIANIIRTIRDMSGGTMDIGFVMVRWIITLLVCLTTYIVMDVTQKFNEENTENIKSAAKAQEEISERMTLTADEIGKNFERANEMLELLKECIDTNNFAMSNIAMSTESTAQAISQQAQMCSAIQESSDEAVKETQRVAEVSKLTSQNVAAGVQLVHDLKKQAEDVEKVGRDTVNATERLEERIDKVKDIVGEILNISSQTNLLALNASIEAARAGEAGRGFAVVADEIRQLSEQTKDATNKITGIIAELIEDAKIASESVDNSVSSINTQSRMIDVTQEKFVQIDSEVAELSKSIHNMESTIASILQATGVISENISHLSATSEEVAASSGEGEKTASEAVERMAECGRILVNIQELSQELKACVRE